MKNFFNIKNLCIFVTLPGTAQSSNNKLMGVPIKFYYQGEKVNPVRLDFRDGKPSSLVVECDCQSNGKSILDYDDVEVVVTEANGNPIKISQ